jgi:hypothetical protein
MSNDYDPLRVIPTDAPPTVACRKKGSFEPALTLMGEHDLCPGCGEPLALRQILDSIEALGHAQDAIGVIGIGCYTALTSLMDVDLIQALHGRAPSVATGAKRMRPDNLIFTLQGDGDMVNEGLQEVIHTAARGENVTCILLNNGVFGETGGHMTSTTVLGQRTKNSIEGRDAKQHGYPILKEIFSRVSKAPPTAPALRYTTPRASPAPAASSTAPSPHRRRAKGSPSLRSSPCVRQVGSSRPRKGPAI